MPTGGLTYQESYAASFGICLQKIGILCYFSRFFFIIFLFITAVISLLIIKKYGFKLKILLILPVIIFVIYLLLGMLEIFIDFKGGLISQDDIKYELNTLLFN